MPLIILTGVPCSGKTTRAKELKEFFENQGKKVNILSEYEEIIKAGFEKNTFYADSNKEKRIRGLLKSEMLRLITPQNVVILDALNYIKGYRYELYCGTKANKCTQCTIHTEINRDQAWQFNENRENDQEKYTRDIFDALVMRYEDPHINNRWDSPLITIYPETTLDLEEINRSIFNKAPPKPNKSTENPPLNSTNFLYCKDRITKEVTDELIKVKTKNLDISTIAGFETFDGNIISKVSINELVHLRRNYLNCTKTTIIDLSKVKNHFLNYLRTSLSAKLS